MRTEFSREPRHTLVPSPLFVFTVLFDDIILSETLMSVVELTIARNRSNL